MHCVLRYPQKNKWENQQVRWKFSNKRDIGNYYRNKKIHWKFSNGRDVGNYYRKEKTKKGNKTKHNGNMRHYVPWAPYPTTDYWLHPMSYHNLTFLHKDLKKSTKHKPNIRYKKARLENSEKLILLLSGYVRHIYTLHTIQIGSSVQEIIRKYVWKISRHSLECMAGTHLLASIIDEYVNAETNKCEFSNNNDFNILNYVYVRGGALRDSYLLRTIRDIDIVVNIYELSRKYLQHLTKYHSNHSSQTDSKCVFWRHYLNKYGAKNENKVNHIPAYPTGDVDVDKILKYEHHIVTCNYLLNAKFIINILSKRKHLSHLFKIEPKYFGLHWLVTLKDVSYDGLHFDNVEFDIVDQTGNSDARYKMFKRFGELRGADNKIKNIVSQIDAYNIENVGISLPLFPFPTHMEFYDFTINSMHINLYQILTNNENKDVIDYNWECKILKQYDHNRTNMCNKIGINDLNNKIIRCPSLAIINEETAEFYFWRLVKLAQKFIDKIHSNIWTIDKKSLKHTIKNYKTWFNHDLMIGFGDRTVKSRSNFINKFLKWGIQTGTDYIRRFKVFRHIKFEKYFINNLKQYPPFAKALAVRINYQMPMSYKKMLKRCFAKFGYPSIGIDVCDNHVASIRYVSSGREFES